MGGSGQEESKKSKGKMGREYRREGSRCQERAGKEPYERKERSAKV